MDVCGDKDIRSYTKADANAFRDELVKQELAGSSITCIFGTVRSVINFAASEAGIKLTNPFSGVYYDRSAGVEDRDPIPIEAIRSLQSQYRSRDDDLRWLVALVSDSGMRLAEAAGLLKEDLDQNDPVPHVVVQEHRWRRLKTSGSNRKVPLVGASLWAAKRLLSKNVDSQFAFSGTTNRKPRTLILPVLR